MSHCYRHPMVKNGNFTFLLTCSGKEWQFHIPTDNASWTTALPKLYFDFFEDNTLWSWYISFMATCTQAVICQCCVLGHILCRKIACHITFIISSTSVYCVLIILFMSEIWSKQIRMITILDIVAVCTIFQLFMTWFAYEFFLFNFSISFYNALATAGMSKL